MTSPIEIELIDPVSDTPIKGERKGSLCGRTIDNLEWCINHKSKRALFIGAAVIVALAAMVLVAVGLTGVLSPPAIVVAIGCAGVGLTLFLLDFMLYQN